MSSSTLRRVSGQTPERGLLDTSVIIGLGGIDPTQLPSEMAISALTLAELGRGPAIAKKEDVRARRQERLQQAEFAFESIEFDAACARAFGRTCGAVVASGRRVGRARVVDLMIAATALVHDLPLFTLNAADLRGLENLIEIVDLGC